MDGYLALKNTLASNYLASVKRDIFYARARRYPSALDAALFDRLVDDVVPGGNDLLVSRRLEEHRHLRQEPRYRPALISASALAASARACSSMMVTAQRSVGFSRFSRAR